MLLHPRWSQPTNATINIAKATLTMDSLVKGILDEPPSSSRLLTHQQSPQLLHPLHLAQETCQQPSRSAEQGLPFHFTAQSFYHFSNASSFLLPISIPLLSSFLITTLLDCRASDNFIDVSIALLHLIYDLPKPISLLLFDGSPTPSGVITHVFNLTIMVPRFASKEVVFYLTKLHQLAKLVLGLSWLFLKNPLVDWVAPTVSPRSPQFPIGHSWPETFSTIPKLHLQDPIQVVPMHTPPIVPTHPVMATLLSVDLKPRNFDLTIATLCFALPYPSSGTTTWYLTLTTLSKDPMEDDPFMVS